jgi:molecular chaperone GrpE
MDDVTLDNNANEEQVVADELSVEEHATSLKKKKMKYDYLQSFENYKDELKERIELYKTNQEVLLAMLPVLDDFDRAMVEILKSDDELLLKGVELIHEKLRNTLFSKGLEQVEVKAGDAFDAILLKQPQIPALRLRWGKLLMF